MLNLLSFKNLTGKKPFPSLLIFLYPGRQTIHWLSRRSQLFFCTKEMKPSIATCQECHQKSPFAVCTAKCEPSGVLWLYGSTFLYHCILQEICRIRKSVLRKNSSVFQLLKQSLPGNHHRFLSTRFFLCIFYGIAIGKKPKKL